MLRTTEGRETPVLITDLMQGLRELLLYLHISSVLFLIFSQEVLNFPNSVYTLGF